MASKITIKDLHRTTGAYVRRAGASRAPLLVTDRGRPVAILASLSLLKPQRRKRKLFADYKALMARRPGRKSTRSRAATG